MDNTESLKGQTAIITGASAGIGRAVSLALATAGVQCVLAARREKELSDVADLIRQSGGNALVVKTDVTKNKDRSELITRTIQEFKKLHILINNAGIYQRGELEHLDDDKLINTLNVNLIAPMQLTKAALPHMKKESHGAIINIASIAGTMGFAGASAYSASKFGMIGFSESLFEEVRESGIKVCSICPGFVATPMAARRKGISQNKLIPPEDVAKTVMDVLTMTTRSCPTKIILRPQYSPYE